MPPLWFPSGVKKKTCCYWVLGIYKRLRSFILKEESFFCKNKLKTKCTTHFNWKLYLALWYWVIKEWTSKLYDYSYLIYPSFRSDFWNLEVQDFRIFTCHRSTGNLCYDPWGESAFYLNNLIIWIGLFRNLSLGMFWHF